MSSTPNTSHQRSPLVADLTKSIVVFAWAILPPLVLCGFLLGPRASTVLLFGSIVGTLNTVTGGGRVGALATTFFLLATPLALLAGLVPLAGACLMAIVCLGVGVSAGWGLHKGLIVVPVGLAYLMVVPLPIRGDSPDPLSQEYLLWVLAGMAVCAFWSVAAVYVLIRNRQLPRPVGNTRADTLEYTVIMTVLASVSMFFVLMYGRDDHGVWLVLTLLVVLQTGAQSTLVKTKRRIVGTIAGALLGALIVSVVPPGVGITILTVAALLGLLTFVLAGPSYYYLYTFCLTLVLILAAAPAGNAIETVIERSVFTLLGALLAVIGMAVGKVLEKRLTPSPADTDPGADSKH